MDYNKILEQIKEKTLRRMALQDPKDYMHENWETVDGKYTVFAKGGRENTGMEALSWIKKCVQNGAGEVVVNSIDTDGVKKGFDIPLLKEVCEIVNVPVIASGGAGCIQDFVTLFNEVPTVDAGLAASIFHFGEVSIKDLKDKLKEQKINVR